MLGSEEKAAERHWKYVEEPPTKPTTQMGVFSVID